MEGIGFHGLVMEGKGICLGFSVTSYEMSVREKQILYDITYMWNLKYGTGESTYKTGTDSQTWRTHLWLPRGRGDGGKDWETGICRYKLVYRGWINKVLLYRTWKYI